MLVNVSIRKLACHQLAYFVCWRMLKSLRPGAQERWGKLQHPQGPIEEGPVDDGELPRSDLPKGVRVRKPLGVSRKCPKQGLQVIEEESAKRSARRTLGVLFCVSVFRS
jgi:hypothetical protein